MQITSDVSGREQAISDLFETTFAASEGAAEGKAIGGLVTDLMTSTPATDLKVYFVQDQQAPIGCVMFSRMWFEGDNRTVFILSPAAIRTDLQGQGIGQKLITAGLNDLRQTGVDIVLTYGDPAFYTKVGFRQITEDMAPAPLPLSFPHGWLGQSLTKDGFAVLSGPSQCVAALNNPEFW